MFARHSLAPLLTVMLVACASESPPPSASPPRVKQVRSQHPGATPPLSRSEATPATNAPPPSDDPEVLSARYEGRQALSRFSGQATYYSDALAGRPTASGEPYRPSALTAAHRTLPFGTVVRVKSEQTGRTVYVRINDRGPFVRGRVLDLSRAAAEKLGLLARGVLTVQAEVVENGPVKKSAKRRTKRRHKAH